MCSIHAEKQQFMVLKHNTLFLYVKYIIASKHRREEKEDERGLSYNIIDNSFRIKSIKYSTIKGGRLNYSTVCRYDLMQYSNKIVGKKKVFFNEITFFNRRTPTAYLTSNVENRRAKVNTFVRYHVNKGHCSIALRC